MLGACSSGAAAASEVRSLEALSPLTTLLLRIIGLKRLLEGSCRFFDQRQLARLLHTHLTSLLLCILVLKRLLEESCRLFDQKQLAKLSPLKSLLLCNTVLKRFLEGRCRLFEERQQARLLQTHLMSN